MISPNPPLNTEVLGYDDAAIARAAALILAGETVAVPTETVYGLAADATSDRAVARIYAAKKRPSFNPLIVHVADRRDAARIARFGSTAERLAEAFWPGPLTMVLPLGSRSPVAGLVTAGLPTIALRMSSHPAMRDLLAACERPLAAPSANASGGISPTRAEHVIASLGGHLALVIDAGPTIAGIESTIVAVDEDRLRLLRLGPVTGAELRAATGLPVLTAQSGTIEAPGQLASHYAPVKPLRLNAIEAREGEWLIGFGPIAGDATLSATGDTIEAAARLFAALHEADASGRHAIAIAPVPDEGIGVAINDRLARAAAPRG